MTATASPPLAATAMPPGPPLPKTLQTLGFILAPARFLDAVRRRYGDVVTLRSLFDERFVMVFSPDLVKEVFRGSPDQLRAGEANAVLEPVVGRGSLLLLDGARHLRERKLMLPPFHGERMRAYAEVMREATDRALDAWPRGAGLPAHRRAQRITLDVIMRAVFGVEAGPRQDELKARIRAVLDPVASRTGILVLALSGGRLGAGAGRRFEAARRRLDEAIHAEISRRRAAPDLAEREDILSMLLLARDEDGEPMKDDELRDELVTLLAAGHETTATGLAWAFELLHRNPRVLARLRAELAAGSEEYLDAVVKETLRIRPVILARRPRRARRAVPARRLRGAAGGRDQPVDLDGAPPPRVLSAAQGVPARALPRGGRARHLHVAARSAAARAAASAPPSRPSRCGSSSGACSSARASSWPTAAPRRACAAGSPTCRPAGCGSGRRWPRPPRAAPPGAGSRPSRSRRPCGEPAGERDDVHAVPGDGAALAAVWFSNTIPGACSALTASRSCAFQASL